MYSKYCFSRPSSLFLCSTQLVFFPEYLSVSSWKRTSARVNTCSSGNCTAPCIVSCAPASSDSIAAATAKRILFMFSLLLDGDAPQCTWIGRVGERRRVQQRGVVPDHHIAHAVLQPELILLLRGMALELI